jgi:glutaredoxin
MQRTILLISFLFVITIGYSQKQKVEVLTKKNKDNYVFSAVNYSTIQQEITLTLTVENLRGYKKPITKLIPAKSTVKLVTLTFIKGKGNKCTSKYSYKPKPTKEEIAFQEKRLKEKSQEDIGDITKGIVVFSKDGCSRCHYTTSYLLDNNIDFKLLNTSENKDYNHLMWTLIKENNPLAGIKNVTMPVILINGKLSHSMKDLKSFVTDLK